MKMTDRKTSGSGTDVLYRKEQGMLRRKRTGVADLLGYAPPTFHDGPSGCYVDYYVRHPNTGELVRKRIKINRVKEKHRRDVYGYRLVAELTEKLQAGWNPWTAGKKEKVATIGEMLDRWDAIKSKHLRHSAGYSYTSMTRIIREWMREKHILDRPITELDREVIAKFMRHIQEERGVSNRTYNNYLIYVSMIGRWLVECSALPQTPVTFFQKMKPGQKSRTYLSDKERSEMLEWIKKNEPDYLFPLLFIYGTLIRPGELRRLRLLHVDMKNQVVQLPAEETKSGIERTPAIPDWMFEQLKEYSLENYPSRSWLIGSKLLPGEKPIGRNHLNRIWVRMRADLGWDSRRQLYSLRDTGIIQLIRDGVDLLHVMQQAGHTEVETTNKYLKHAFPKGPAEVRQKATSLKAASSFG